MPRGRKPQPKEQKIAKGETRPSRHLENVVEFPKVDEVPEPPSYVAQFPAGVNLWEEVAPVLFAQRVLSEPDVHALGHLCRLHGEIVDGYERRLSPTASMLSQLRMLFAEFGMTPASRSRVASGKDPGKGNKFGSNGQRGKAKSQTD